MSVSDLGNTGSGGVLTADASVAITVVSINDAPEISGAMQLFVAEEDVKTALAGITVQDADAHAASADIAAGSPTESAENAEAPALALLSR